MLLRRRTTPQFGGKENALLDIHCALGLPQSRTSAASPLCTDSPSPPVPVRQPVFKAFPEIHRNGLGCQHHYTANQPSVQGRVIIFFLSAVVLQKSLHKRI